MRKAIRLLAWFTALIMGVAWLVGAEYWPEFAFQSDRNYRNISGLVLMGIILFQWSLTLGRTVFQRTGSQWGGWIDWHLKSALILPPAILAHSITYGWGLLALLPLVLLGSAHFGSLLQGEAAIRKNLKYHIGLSAITLALAVVHAVTVLIFN